jgi:hypothetical protein
MRIPNQNARINHSFLLKPIKELLTFAFFCIIASTFVTE